MCQELLLGTQDSRLNKAWVLPTRRRMQADIESKPSPPRIIKTSTKDRDSTIDRIEREETSLRE